MWTLKNLAFALILLLLWLVLLLAKTPATFVLSKIDLGESFTYAHAQGTLWHGEIMQASLKLNDKTIPLGKLSWQMQAWPLLLGRVSAIIQIKHPEQRLQAQLSRSLSQVRVSDVNATMPLTALSSVIPVSNVSGIATIDIETLAWNIKQAQVVDLNGTITMKSLRVPLVSDNPLGDYQATLTLAENNADVISVKANDTQATLGLEVGLTVEQSQHTWALLVNATIKDTSDPKLDGLLSAVMRKQSTGVYQYKKVDRYQPWFSANDGAATQDDSKINP